MSRKSDFLEKYLLRFRSMKLLPARPGFENIAHFYDIMMHFVFGKTIRDSQICFLNKLPPQAHIFIIGGGTGWILTEVFKICPLAKITYLEISPKMIALAKSKLNLYQLQNINFILGDEKHIPNNAQFDAVFTHFFLDLFPPEKAQKISNQLLHILKPKGLWFYADFSTGRKENHLRKYFIQFMYRIANVLCTLENTQYWKYSSCLHTAKLKKQRDEYFFFQCIEAILYQKSPC